MKSNNERTYDIFHLNEDYRIHNFRAKAGHYIQSNPTSKLEWQEIMQHHMVKTRLLDWTESAITSLLFALEPYFMPGSDPTNNVKMSSMTPVIWIISPYQLNSQVYDTLSSQNNRKRFHYIERALHGFPVNVIRLSKRIGHELSKNKAIYFDEPSNGDNHRLMNLSSGLINLSAIEHEWKRYSGRLMEAIVSFEFNPFHFLLYRYYVDGIITAITPDDRGSAFHILPPLATIHQYHSKRIEAQRGVFLVTPHYSLTPRAEILKSYGVDLRSLEMQDKNGGLMKIRLINPKKLSQELRSVGERRSSIYPELSVYSEEIEAAQLI